MPDLKTFIDSEPLNAGRTDQQVYEWGLESISVIGQISRNRLLGWAAQTNAIKRLEDFRVNVDQAVQGLAYAALEVIRGDGLDLGDDTAQALLAQMVAKSMFVQAEIDALNALATGQIARHAAAGVPWKLGYVIKVRAA